VEMNLNLIMYDLKGISPETSVTYMAINSRKTVFSPQVYPAFPANPVKSHQAIRNNNGMVWHDRTRVFSKQGKGYDMPHRTKKKVHFASTLADPYESENKKSKCLDLSTPKCQCFDRIALNEPNNPLNKPGLTV